jgi:hypothetical protein
MLIYLIQILLAVGIGMLFYENLLLFSAPADKKRLFYGGRWVLGVLFLVFFALGFLLADVVALFSGKFSLHLGAALTALIGAKTVISRWKKQIAYHVYYVHNFGSLLLLGTASGITSMLLGLAYGLNQYGFSTMISTLAATMVVSLMIQKKTGNEKQARTISLIGGFWILLAAVLMLILQIQTMAATD